jgi:hypothetical protein
MRVLEASPSTLLADVTLRLITKQIPSADEPNLILHESGFPIPGIPGDVVWESEMSPRHLFAALWAFHTTGGCSPDEKRITQKPVPFLPELMALDQHSIGMSGTIVPTVKSRLGH